MKPLPASPDLLRIAQRVVWFEPPDRAMADPIRFLAYAMTYGTADDIAILKHHVGDDGFREAIEKAPPGILDERSWAYWNALAGRYPPPPLPVRRLPG